MYGKNLRQSAMAALCLVSLNSLAAQDFSGLDTTELTKLKPSEMSEEDRSAFRAEMQKRSVNMSAAEKDEFRDQMHEQKKAGGGRGMQGRGGMQGGMGRGR